jgi:excisionase family DNA binding protein
MEDAMEQLHDDGMVTIEEAARREAVSEQTIRRRIASGELPSFVSARDKRRRLVTTADLDRVFRPTPVQRLEARR